MVVDKTGTDPLISLPPPPLLCLPCSLNSDTILTQER
jgi:hypothetical protein